MKCIGFIPSSVFMNKYETSKRGKGVIDVNLLEDEAEFITEEYVNRCIKHFYGLSNSKGIIDEIREWIIETYIEQEYDDFDVQIYKNGRDILPDCDFHIIIKFLPDSDTLIYDIYGRRFYYENVDDIMIHVMYDEIMNNGKIQLMYDGTYYGEYVKEINITKIK